jgi:hypothetical protein
VTSNESVRDSLSVCSMYIGRVVRRMLFNCDQLLIFLESIATAMRMKGSDERSRVRQNWMSRSTQTTRIDHFSRQYCSELLTAETISMGMIYAARAAIRRLY